METLVDKHGKVKRKVAYFYDPDVGNFHYGQGSFMITDTTTASG